MIETLNDDQRMAMLLTLLGDKTTELALRQLPAKRAHTLLEIIEDYRDDPPSMDDIDELLSDFERYFRFAMNSLNRTNNGELGEDEADEVLAKRQSRKAVQRIEFIQVAATSDPADGLNRLVPYQIATAIKHDQPKTIALILSQMLPENAARVLEELSESTRAAAFIFLSQPLNVPRPIIDKVLQSAFDRANAVREQVKESDRVEQLVELMRSLPKKVRSELLAKLVEESEELAENVKSKLYRFDDLMRLDDRSVQAVLSRISSTTLVMALTRADKGLTAKMFANMSKRARQTIEEEIGFNEKATEDEINMSRIEIAQTIGKMDESGEISL